jgi:copper chaperone CopZ
MKFSVGLILFLLFSSLVFSGCNSGDESATSTVDNRSCSIAIEGMMCEKGCKTTIQNKLSEMEGVIQCEVNFEMNQAYITYDGNKLKAQDFIDKIEGIADGDLYKATIIEDKDIENAPVEIEQGDVNHSVSVSDFSLQIPNFIDFFLENIRC